jgi:hypothetical protein
MIFRVILFIGAATPERASPTCAASPLFQEQDEVARATTFGGLERSDKKKDFR